MKVLVVDDNPANRLLACAFVDEEGWESAEAASGAEALKLMQRGSYDVVLLDISMPDISGDQVCRAVKADADLARMRVIAYTAHVLPDEISAIMTAGFDGFLPKPVNRRALLQALRPQGMVEPPQELI